MASIWKKTFGKRNAKKNVARELSEKIIEYKNDYGYETIAEAVVQVGNSYEFAKDMDHAAPIYAVWRSAKELNVLDVAVMRAITEQDKYEDESDSNDNSDDHSGLVLA
ncbi:hypothetical protein DKZ29_09035 [Limosilactobacillus reuteri]|uniref:Uncharacterized protein n=2 Tax=Limosilactobacillus reuteri TaxID=1598 RepID=A0A855XT81_LIMRT|nr:hypothetical protein [Limosilactobacillus reuteri]PWT34462.1 hypothetical protein DKZ24_08715 [Limosilactobacillus reuteri]PWT39581.1 hypothetical protein DKZ22_10725 [Limosilactobacillus reuteri]PWT55816.1 hypothetical protein DKZ31_01680 [Limosilactobacillus reuteri]PWT57249.1 hypothetical protein DKZ29_09035 [Limosilactobacillus reuteri]PWT58057.1 hypothetical protein DKZ30_08890 [Limosilactobacillus reuteri]